MSRSSMIENYAEGEKHLPATSCVRCSLRRRFAPAPTRNSLHISRCRIAFYLLSMPAKAMLLRHASAGAASRCVTTRALLIVAGMMFSPLSVVLLMQTQIQRARLASKSCTLNKKLRKCKIVVFYERDADTSRYSSATACTSSTE